MPNVHANMMIRLALALGAVTQLLGCGGSDGAASAHDPCTLLSAREAAPYVGTLASPPYRASDGTADVSGDQCMYRGQDGREIAIRPDWDGGHLMGGVLQQVPNVVGKALSKAGAVGLDTMAHRVMKPEQGPWDKATWIPGGSLFASKGDDQVIVDVSGASGRESDALALATMIMPRFGHPLDYDGRKAVALAPKPRPHPGQLCDLVPRAEVEAAIGSLDGQPNTDSPESCTYRVATRQGERSYPVEIMWQGGQKNYSMLIHGMATLSGMLGTPSSSPLDTMKLPPQMQAAIGGLMKMVGGAPAGSATGAAATVGFKTDTTLTGPWDHAALLHGTQLLAVRHDISVGMTLESADYEKAKALLAAICSHL